jgi:four helix bundle protein
MRDHKSIRAWQEAHQVTVQVIGLSRAYWKPYAAALFAQLQRASLSIQLNIAEGYTFGNSPSFTRHLGIAYGSAVETGELLELALDAEILSKESATLTLAGVRNTQQLLLGLLKKRRKFARSAQP